MVILLLRVSNRYFVAGADWEKDLCGWVCVRAAPMLHWMVGMSPDAAKSELIRRGCTWEWITVVGR